MLFVVLLGGKHPRAKIEVHDVVFAVADSLQEAHSQLREGWFGSPSGLHIDSWMAVDGVAQWKVELSGLAPAPQAPRLFFINLGGYEPGTFGEAHRYRLVVARDKREARVEAKRLMPEAWEKSHTDAVLDVDDCLPIDRVDGRYVHLVEGAHRGIVQGNDYVVLS